MRRFTAILLIGVFSFSLIPAVMFARYATGQIPECCRRSGKHHCSMGQQPGSDDAVAKLTGTCPFYSQGDSGLTLSITEYVKPAGTLSPGIPVHVSVRRETSADFRTVVSRSCQKRGPPPLLS